MPTTEQRLGAVGVSAYLPTMLTLPPIHLPTLPPLWEKGYHDRPLMAERAIAADDRLCAGQPAPIMDAQTQCASLPPA